MRVLLVILHPACKDKTAKNAHLMLGSIFLVHGLRHVQQPFEPDMINASARSSAVPN
jgi:hypothetical protein